MNRSILHVIASLEGGGAERQLALLASEQVRRGWRVELALRRGGVYETVLDPGVTIHRLGDHAGADPRLLARLLHLVRAVRPDVVQTWLPQMDVLGGAAALAHRTPWVMTERSVAAAYPTGWATTVRAWIGQRADAVVANSCAGASLWRRAVVIPNAIELAIGEPRDDAKLVFAGRLVADKAPELLIDALVRVPRVRVVMFGEGPLRARLQAEIDRHGLDVTLAGFRSDWTLQLATATALINPSRVEGEPNVVLEAMAAGCPVIASDIPAHRELLADDRGILVAVDDPAALAAAITAVLADPRARDRAHHARDHVRDRTIAVTADRYEQVYTRVNAPARAGRTRLP